MAQQHPSDVWDGGIPTLPWQASTALLCLACVPVAWVCRATGARGWPDDLVPWVLTLIVLVGLLPYYMRRNHAFTLGGLVIAAGVGLVLAALGWLMGYNFIVLVWLGWRGRCGRWRMPRRTGAASSIKLRWRSPIVRSG